MRKHKKTEGLDLRKIIRPQIITKNIFPRDIKNFIKMRLPKPSIPPPITFLMFLLILVSNIENYSAKNGRRGWGRERKTELFFFFPPAIPQVNRELRQKLKLTSVLLSTAFITFRKKKSSTRSKAIRSVQKRDAKQKSARTGQGHPTRVQLKTT